MIVSIGLILTYEDIYMLKNIIKWRLFRYLTRIDQRTILMLNIYHALQ